MRRLSLLLALALSACGQPVPVGHFAGTAPEIDAIAFWTGHHRSWGVLENRSGGPTDTVVTDCVGIVAPDGTLHMVQTLTLGDGSVQHRDWHMRRTGPHSFVATANDMVGQADGISAGRVFHWRWVLALSPGDPLKNVVMDQWMYLMDGGSMMNRTTISKLGITLAEVSEEFQTAP
jgi:hypothetical protein